MSTHDPSRPLLIEAGAVTDTGHRRQRNEDSYLVGFPIFAVADGMGGHDAGDRASQAVVLELSPLVGMVGADTEAFELALERARRAVAEIADETERRAGSTVTGVFVVQLNGLAHWLVFNIGDSRVYRLNDESFAQLTVDHSLAQELIDRGVDEVAVAVLAGSNVITRAVGADDSEADYWLHPIADHDRMLLCSDGLTAEVADDQIHSILASTSRAQDAAEALVALALHNGGRDNVTVVILDVVEGALGSAPPKRG